MGTAATLDEIMRRLDRLEAESAIRTVMADYMRLCDRLDADTPMDQLGDLFAPDAVWGGRGGRYAATFGQHRGRDTILAMLDRYRVPLPHFTLNAHFLTSETIAVDGDTAVGGWVMLQTSTYAAGPSDLRAARLTVTFARSDGRWRISRFETENLFSRPVDRWDDPAPVPVPS
ncbi:nuclear transport factor 2 family protein [Azospirillum sp. B4]|uniref:nuclear transport factor 2 family protein n=1 Tax=Azospirillum sp. B4 TaxID=95605 RepID=UPI0005CAEB66|nr:nuclear transport factor 2 family protein [Azospirillum sp. B4]